MNKSKLDRQHIKLVIAHGLASGWSQRGIATMIGTSQATISRIARQADVLEMIKYEDSMLVDNVKAMLDEIRKDPAIQKEFEKEITKELFKGLGQTFKEYRRG